MDESSNQEPKIEDKRIVFPNNDRLTASVIEGSFRYFIGEFGVFVLFLIDDGVGISICYARGKQDGEPTGERFERLITFPTLEEAKAAYPRVEETAIKHLKEISTETNL